MRDDGNDKIYNVAYHIFDFKICMAVSYLGKGNLEATKNSEVGGPFMGLYKLPVN